MIKILRVAGVVFLTINLVVSCGGGAGDSSSGNNLIGDDNDPGGGGSDNDDVVDTFNGGLGGQLFFGGYGEGWLLDLTTGKYERIPGIDWENESGFYGGASFRAYPLAYDGSVVVAEIDDCLRENSQNYDCLARYSDTGEQLGDIYRLPSDVSVVGVPKLSPSGDYIAFFYEVDTSGSADDLWLIITDLNLTTISEALVYTEVYTASGPSLTWLPDNRLSFTIEESIFVLSIALDATSAESLVQFSEQEGEPRDISASPDGTKLAFSLVSSSSSRTSTATPWVIDTDGNNRQGLRQLARVEENNSSNFKFPTWSPDGQSIFFSHGNVDAASNTDLGLQGGGYVIPAASENLLLTDDNIEIIHIQSYFGMTSGNSNAELTTDLDIDEPPVAWIP